MKRGKAKIVMLPVEQYELMKDRAQSGEPKVFTLRTAPDEDIAMLMTGLQEIIDADDRGDR